MPDRIFVDTNILVYAHDGSAGSKHAAAKGLVQELWEHQTGCVSIQVLQEFYVSVTQKVPTPMDHKIAQMIIRDLSHWKVHEPKSDDVINAIDIQQQYQISFWDAMILQSALHLECNFLWSEDLSPGQVYETVKLVNPLQQ